jgi:hypothetical protein
VVGPEVPTPEFHRKSADDRNGVDSIAPTAQQVSDVSSRKTRNQRDRFAAIFG